jgi:hypothetical protein
MSSQSGQSGKENTEPDNVNVGLVATVTVVGALLVIAIAAALTALVRSETARHGTEAGTFANLGAVERLRAEQQGKLHGAPAWSDRATGHVSVPIDRAMQLVASEIQKNPYLATPLPPKPKAEPDAGVAPAGAGADGGAPPPAAGSAAPAAPGSAQAPVPAPAGSGAQPGAPAPSAGAQ